MMECSGVHPHEGRGENEALNAGNLLRPPFLTPHNVNKAVLHHIVLLMG